MAEDVEKPYETKAEAEEGKQSDSHGNGSGFVVDTRYIRSIEGILRLASIPFTIVFFILMVLARHGYGGWNAFVGISWIVYVVVVFVVEMLIPGVFVHRLVDAIIAIVFAALFGVAVLLGIIFAALPDTFTGALAAGAVFAAICCGLATASAVFALRTWQTYEGGTKGSVAIFFI